MQYTYKGKPVDMASLQMMNEHAVALGNANLNARGDVLGRGGKIVITSEEIAEDYYKQQAATATRTNEAPAIADNKPPVEEFDPSLLSGYDNEEPEAAVVKPKRKKAPKAGE